MSSKLSSLLVLVLLAGVAASVRSYLRGWESLEERRPSDAFEAAPAQTEPEGQAQSPEVQPVAEQSPAPACEPAPSPAPAAAARSSEPGPCAAAPPTPAVPAARLERPAAELSPSRAFHAEHSLPLPLGPLGVQLPGPSVVLPDDPI